MHKITITESFGKKHQVEAKNFTRSQKSSGSDGPLKTLWFLSNQSLQGLAIIALDYTRQVVRDGSTPLTATTSVFITPLGQVLFDLP